VYGELLEMKRSALATTEGMAASMTEAARDDVSFDVRLLGAQAERYRLRHEYWTARAAELSRR
jgi:DhnA family fructose-bisphosphate aldolase class Ia